MQLYFIFFFLEAISQAWYIVGCLFAVCAEHIRRYSFHSEVVDCRHGRFVRCIFHCLCMLLLYDAHCYINECDRNERRCASWRILFHDITFIGTGMRWCRWHSLLLGKYGRSIDVYCWCRGNILEIHVSTVYNYWRH
jgi:hypothetical protein